MKKVAERDADVRAGKWRTRENFAYYVGSRASDGFPGQTIGLVGLGRIGTRVAQLLAPWRARIIAYDPYVPPAHFLTHGVDARSTTRRCCGSPTWCRSTSCSPGDPLHVRREASSS